MKKLISFLVIILLLGSFMIGTEAVAQDESVTIRLPWLKNVQFAGPIIAQETGIYEDLGVNVEIEPGGGDVSSIPLVVGGEDDFGIHDTNSLIYARSEGMPLTATTTVFQRHPGGMFALEESGIETPQDFVGKTLGYQEGGPWELTQAMLKYEGVSLDDIETTTVPFDITPLLTGEIDIMFAYAVNEPIQAELEGYDVNIILPYDYGIEAASEALFTREDMIENNPELVEKVTHGTLKGWAYAIQNQEEAVEIVMDVNPDLDKEHQQNQLEAQIDYIFTEDSLLNGIGYMSEEAWVAMQDVLLDVGDLDEPIDINEVFTTEFLPNK